MKPISVVISSLRPEALELTIDSTAMHSDLIEIIVVSPWPPKPRDFVKHVPVPHPPPGDPGEREQAGELSLSKKINLGLPHASGEYIAFNSDDLHFRQGWAPTLLKHMEENRHGAHPYLARFHTAMGGVTSPIYTVFGIHYANLGCISKSDLSLIGGYLYDERMRTEYVDPDLSLRVWAAGGRVGTYPEVVIDLDTYTKLDPKKPDPLCTPYKSFWLVKDATAFFDIWFWKYFWLFFRNYPSLSARLTNADNVLTKDLRNGGAIKIFWRPLVKLLVYSLLRRDSEAEVVKSNLSRLVNRRWATLDYELPYAAKAIIRKGR